MTSKGSGEITVAESHEDKDEKEVKKRRFRPLKAMRRFFASRRKTKSFNEDPDMHSSRPKSAFVSSHEEPYHVGATSSLPSKHFSMSADSVFTAAMAADGRHSSNIQGLQNTATSIPELHIHHSKLKDELFKTISEQDLSDDDGLPRSISTQSSTGILIGDSLKSKSKSMSRDSEQSLYSMDSAELDEEFFSSSPTSGGFFKASVSSLDSDLDLDAVSPSESLDITAAKHKSAIRPKSRRKPSKKSQSLKSPRSPPPANLTSVSEESPSKISFPSDEKRDIEKESVVEKKTDTKRASSLEILPSKEVKKEDAEVESINSNQKVIMRQKRLASSSPIEKEHENLLLEMKRKSFNKSLESVTMDKDLKPRTPSPEQVSEFSKAFDKFKRRSVYQDEKTPESSNKDGATVEKKTELKSPGGKIGAVNLSMFENKSPVGEKPVDKKEDSPTKSSSQPWRSKTAPVDPVAFKVAQSKSSDALTVDKAPIKRVSSHEVANAPKQSNVKAENKRFSAVEPGSSGGGGPAWISLARKKQKDPEPQSKEKEDTSEKPVLKETLSISPPKSPGLKSPRSPIAKSPIFEKQPPSESVPAWKAQLKKNKEDAVKSKEETKSENVPAWRKQNKSPERKPEPVKVTIVKKNEDQNVPAWKRQQGKTPEKTAQQTDNKTQSQTQSSSIVKRFSKNFEDEPKKKPDFIDIKSRNEQKRSEKISPAPEPVNPETCSSATKKQPQKVLDMVKNFQNMQVS